MEKEKRKTKWAINWSKKVYFKKGEEIIIQEISLFEDEEELFLVSPRFI